MLAPGDRVSRPLAEAVRDLEEWLGQPIVGLVSVEIGGYNAGAILDASANTGKRLIDGDYAGRAIPELQASVLHLFGAKVSPWALVDEFGNRLLLRDSPSDAFAERIGKYLALASFGAIACAFAPLPAREVGRIYVPNTLTECLELGRVIRLAREAGADPVAAAAQKLKGWMLFQGTVTKREWANTGYMEGLHEITGERGYRGQTLRVWFKNENHVTWLNERPYVCSPDLVEVCDAETAEPLQNTYLKEGDRVAVVGRRRREAFESDAGIAAFGPRHFGWDIKFTPIEVLLGSNQGT